MANLGMFQDPWLGHLYEPQSGGVVEYFLHCLNYPQFPNILLLQWSAQQLATVECYPVVSVHTELPSHFHDLSLLGNQHHHLPNLQLQWYQTELRQRNFDYAQRQYRAPGEGGVYSQAWVH